MKKVLLATVLLLVAWPCAYSMPVVADGEHEVTAPSYLQYPQSTGRNGDGQGEITFAEITSAIHQAGDPFGKCCDACDRCEEKKGAMVCKRNSGRLLCCPKACSFL